MDLGAKFTGFICTRELEGYRVIADNVPISHHSIIAVFYCEVEHAIETLLIHGPNVVSFQMASGGGAVVACYWVLHRPVRRLGHREHHFGHQTALPRLVTNGGRQLRCGPF